MIRSILKSIKQGIKNIMHPNIELEECSAYVVYNNHFMEDKFRIVAEVDKSITDYYFSLIPKYKNAKPQYHIPHITILRTGIEAPVKKESWKKFDKQVIKIFYNPSIKETFPYFYLEVYSETIQEIRRSLGLPEYREGYKCYHLTLGNCKKPVYKQEICESCGRVTRFVESRETVVLCKCGHSIVTKNSLVMESMNKEFVKDEGVLLKGLLWETILV